MASFWRRLLKSLDFEHEQNRIERKATVFAAPIGPKPTRETHPDYVERESRGGLVEAEMSAYARQAARERESRRRAI
jgi:hypothetical protein